MPFSNFNPYSFVKNDVKSEQFFLSLFLFQRPVENSVFVTKQFIRTSLTNKNYSELQSQEYYVSNDPHSC